MKRLLLRVLGGIAGLVLVLVIIYLAGPRPRFEPVTDNFGGTLDGVGTLQQLQDWLQTREASLGDLKPGNDARIIWADSIRRTEWAIVYLHGFSAGPREGDPVLRELAKHHQANLFEARLARHGRSQSDPFLELEPKELTMSAAEALEIGDMIGEKVLLVSCSTGSTLALWLASRNPEKVDGLICWSPNIDVEDQSSDLLLGPWGKQLAYAVFPDGYREFEADDSVRRYWTNRYRVEGVIAMKSLLDQTMREETFSAISDPVFFGLWYQSDEVRDMVISREAAQQAFAQIGTADELKVWVDFADVDAHVLASRHYSRDLEEVLDRAIAFTTEVVGMPVSEDAAEKH